MLSAWRPPAGVLGPASSIIPIAVANIVPWRSAARFVTPGSLPPWAPGAMPMTTPPARASWPASRPNSHKRQTFKTRDEARLAVFSYIEGFYNPQAQALGSRLPISG